VRLILRALSCVKNEILEEAAISLFSRSFRDQPAQSPLVTVSRACSDVSVVQRGLLSHHGLTVRQTRAGQTQLTGLKISTL